MFYGNGNILDYDRVERIVEGNKKQVKGRHEPIITVEEYERVQKIMKSKTGKLINPTTGRKLTGVTPPKTVWGRLMICSCGRRFNRRKWHTNANEEKRYGYPCYGTTQTGTVAVA